MSLNDTKEFLRMEAIGLSMVIYVSNSIPIFQSESAGWLKSFSTLMEEKEIEG